MQELRFIDAPLFGKKSNLSNPEGIATLYSCVRLIANTIAQTPIFHINKSQEIQTDSDLSILLKSPQPNNTFYFWLNNLTHDLVLNGNAYALIFEGNLLYIPSTNVQVFVTNNQEIPYYYQVSFSGNTHTIYPEDIIHLKNISEDGYVGISPIQQHRKTLDSSYSMQDYTANFIENSSALSGLIKSTKPLNKEKFEEIRQGFRDNYGGSKNAGKTAILGDGLDFTPLKPTSPTDIDFINNYKLNKTLIAEIFNVPLSMLGTSDMSYNNAEQMSLSFQNYTINPILKQIEQELTLKLISSRSKDKLIFMVDTLSLASSKEKADSLSLLVNTQIFTPNEARQKYGLPPIEGGNKLLQKEPTNTAAPKNKTAEGTNQTAEAVKPPSKRNLNAD